MMMKVTSLPDQSVYWQLTVVILFSFLSIMVSPAESALLQKAYSIYCTPTDFRIKGAMNSLWTLTNGHELYNMERLSTNHYLL